MIPRFLVFNFHPAYSSRMEQAWLDSLSEDWVSQPRSQPASSSQPSSPRLTGDSSASRIPRPKSGTSSIRGSTGNPKDVLRARTPSQINASSTKLPDSQGKSPSVRSPSPNRKSFAKNVSQRSVRGTVQQKSNSAAAAQDQGTPEWKRRLVNGKKSAGEATDLLSPKGSGLESVFKPPTLRAKEAPRGISRRRQPLGETEDDKETAIAAPSELQIQSEADRKLRAALPDREHNEDAEAEGHSRFTAEAESLLGSEESHSDNFSPALLSKHTAANGQIHYTATPSPKKRTSIQESAVQPRRSMSLSSGVQQAQTQSQRQIDEVRNHSHLPDITSQSLPDDLSVGTDAFIANGGYIETRRGGYTENASFQQRSLAALSSDELGGSSPAGSEDSVRRYPEKSPSPSKIDERPVTPERTEGAGTGGTEYPKSSGSPLKLFDNYDSFTNERLLRRMSKFEQTLAQGSEERSEQANASLSPSPQRMSSGPGAGRGERGLRKDDSRVSSFGDGELDYCPFTDTLDHEPSLPRYPDSSALDLDSEIVRSSRSKAKVKADIQRRRDLDFTKSLRAAPEQRFQQKGEPSVKQGKRQRHSPLKSTASKRRKTIEDSSNAQMAFASETNLSHFHSPPVKSLLGRKRKDARYDKGKTDADPETLAMRQIRRPRNPTPNQASNSDQQASARMSPNSPRYTSVWEKRKAGATQDRSTHILADVLVTNALHAAKNVAGGSRKPSVTTDDYFNEAQAIMNLIRSEKRPRSSHQNFDQSGHGQYTIYEESMFLESTRDDFSRPPSRGSSMPSKSRAMPSLDARAVSQLRKFEDHDDLGLALGNSVKTLHLGHSAPGSASGHDPSMDGNFESDPPNVRIRERLEHHQYLANSDGAKSLHRRQGSEDSNGSSGRSIPTRSSASSSNRMIIAPESVAHLLNDRIAGMTFDRDRQKWVKANMSKREQVDVEQDGAADSDDDLFNNIPDLSVDEMEELQRVRDAVVESQSLGKEARSEARTATPPELQRQPAGAMVTDDARPRTAEGKSIPLGDDSSAPSKFSHFASSGAYPSTRATSWGAEDMWSVKMQPRQAPNLASVAEHQDGHNAGDVEHEISILEGRAPVASKETDRSRRARVVTVTFSSPVVNQMHSPARPEYSEDDIAVSAGPQSWRSDGSQIGPSMRSKSASPSMRDSPRPASRRLSFDSPPRPISRVEEHNEMSLVRYSPKGNKTLDLAITTPLPLCRSLLAPSSTEKSSSLGFKLSPLQDFTVHQVDRSLDGDSGAIVKASAGHDLATPSKKLSLTAQEVIKHLTDLEPFEPYWEYIRYIDFQGRSLRSLHMLDEFCGQLVHLNAARNEVNELNGVPVSVRSLQIQNNCISDLSSWHHLQNLQFLDVSSNSLTSLKGLWDLVHLRGLKVDSNAIDSLTGLEGLDGLVSLSARGNKLQRVDFEDFDL